MSGNAQKCAERRRKTEKDGEKKGKENNTMKSALILDKIQKKGILTVFEEIATQEALTAPHRQRKKTRTKAKFFQKKKLEFEWKRCM